MKRVCLVSCLLVFLFPPLIKAQFGDESPIPYFRYSVTGGLGPTLLYGDLDSKQVGGAVYLKGNYFLAHGVSIGLELQEGLLRGTDETYIGNSLRETNNFYHAGILGVTFQPFKYFQDDHLRRIEFRESYGKRVLNSAFVGAGMGALYSLQWSKNRDWVQPAHHGNDQGFSYIVSTNAGLELPLHSLKPNLLDSYIWNLVARAQLNFSLDDELDGYSGNYPGNDRKDVYGLFSIGVNLRF